MSPGAYETIYEVIRRIPRGKVATYGQIAYIVGPPCTARRVGWALGALRGRSSGPPVPWQRVVNARGESSVGSVQMDLLVGEGIELDADGRIDLERFGWDGYSAD